MSTADQEKGTVPADPIRSVANNPVDEITPASSVKDLDDNYELYKNYHDAEIDPAEAKRVLRKIDARIVTILFVTYMLQYLDKNTINFASVYGLQAGTHLVGQDYSWLGSIFYFGYLAFQFPSTFLLQRLATGRVLSITTLCWGIILITTPACSSFAGIATNRFLLGAFESTVNPGFILVMSMWYTAAEQPLRLESYYCTNGIATMFGGLIGYAVGHITTGLPKWMYVFIIFGAISVAWGIVSLLFLPSNPSTARFLTERERAIAIRRVAANRQGIKNHHFRTYQAWQTVRDPKTWILFVMAVAAQIPNSALTSFASIIVGTFGFDQLGTQYMQIPGGAVQFLALLTGGWICTHWPRNTRCITMMVANSICIIGAGLLVGLPSSNKWGRLVALWLCYFQGLGFSMSLTMVSSNVAGYTKKQLTAAILFVGYSVGNIIGPQTFIASEAPGYHSAYIAMLIGYSIKLTMVVVLYIYMWRVNVARDREAASALGTASAPLGENAGPVPVGVAGGVGTGGGPTVGDGPLNVATVWEQQGIELGMHDVTELDNKAFRYIL